MPSRLELTDKIFGRLTVTSFAYMKNGNSHWHCVCSCGKEITINGRYLLTGDTKSCGCFRREKMTLHGASNSRAFRIWTNMVQRCTNSNNKNFSRYGGRGIRICERWQSFSNFLADMGDPPQGLELDRINNDGDYCPGNCRWTTHKQNALNKGNTIRLEYEGRTWTIPELAARLPIDERSFRLRLQQGWSVEEAMLPLKTSRLPPHIVMALRQERKEAYYLHVFLQRHNLTFASSICSIYGLR